MKLGRLFPFSATPGPSPTVDGQWSPVVLAGSPHPYDPNTDSSEGSGGLSGQGPWNPATQSSASAGPALVLQSSQNPPPGLTLYPVTTGFPLPQVDANGLPIDNLPAPIPTNVILPRDVGSSSGVTANSPPQTISVESSALPPAVQTAARSISNMLDGTPTPVLDQQIAAQPVDGKVKVLLAGLLIWFFYEKL